VDRPGVAEAGLGDAQDEGVVVFADALNEATAR
jgi:hypothetical protein